MLEDIESHPAFINHIDPSSDNPAVAALQALKYESEDPNANALSYKEEGNYCYKRKEFRKAIDSYTGGLQVKPTDRELIAVLHTNRAIVHFCLKNYGSCIRDCKSAISDDPTHQKAYVKGAEASLALEKVDQCLEFCKQGSERFRDNEKFSQFRMEALKIQAKLDEANAKRLKVQQKTDDRRLIIYKSVQDKGVNINFKLQPVNVPEAAGANFYVDASNRFHWSVLFMYPEFGQTDFLQDVIESSTVTECLEMVFDPSQLPPSWDPHRLYQANEDCIEVYFEDSLKAQKLTTFPMESTIKKLTRRKDFCVRRDLLIIIHVVCKKSSKFYDRWKAGL